MKNKLKMALTGFMILTFSALVYYGLILYSFKRQNIALPALLSSVSNQAMSILNVPDTGIITITYFDDESILVSNSKDNKPILIKSIEFLPSILKGESLDSRLLIFYGGNKNTKKGINSKLYRNLNKEKKILKKFNEMRRVHKS